MLDHDSPDISFSSVKKGRLTVQPGSPLILSDTAIEGSTVSKEDRRKLSQLGRTIKAYLQAARELLAGKYTELRDSAPLHMTDACLPTVFLFEDGVIVRYDLVS